MNVKKELKNVYKKIRNVRNDYESMKRTVWFDEYIRNRGKKYEEEYTKAKKAEENLIIKLKSDPVLINRVEKLIEAYKNSRYKLVPAGWAIVEYEFIRDTTLSVHVELHDKDGYTYDDVIDIKV